MQKSVEIKSRNLTLRGTLHTPDEMLKRIPLVIILHGFGGNKMGPHFMFINFSRLLESRGFATLRFDFAGSGESDGEFINMTLSGELEDSINILDYAKTLEFVDSEGIYVVGFSMGGAVASLLAGKRSNDIKALCLWAPAGNMEEIVVNDFIGKGYHEFILNGYHDYEGLLIGKNFVKDLSEIDIYKEASKYDGNILILHGDSDEVVSLSASVKYAENYGEKSSLVTIDGADHLFSKHKWEQDIINFSIDFFESQLSLLNAKEIFHY